MADLLSVNQELLALDIGVSNITTLPSATTTNFHFVNL